jgi:capsule polysaccharide export protein KpsE/RkpR
MNEQSYDINSNGIFYFLRRRRNVLLIISSLAFISSIIFSLLIEDKYESSVILFPSTTTSISRALLNDENYKEKDFLEFGEEEEAEQLIQLLNSDTIRNYIIQKFNLMSHYDINPHEEYRQTELFNEYKGNIDFYRTKFMSVKIEVLDTDKEYAANIANEITKKVDEVRNNILQKAAKQGFVIVEKEYNNLVAEINRMEDTLNQIRAKGVQDYETQVEVLSNQYGAALVKGNNAAVKALQNKLDTLSKYGGKYLSLVQQMEYEREKLSDLKKVYSEARVNAESTIDQTFIVNRAYPAEKASYPIRWIIVVASTIATFLFTVIVLILFDPKA